MIEHDNTIIVIPARMVARRLPGKPLVDLHGLPMIVHVWKRAKAANIGHVLVAAAENQIADAVRAAGGDAMVTPLNLAASVDRISAALKLRDPQHRFSNILSLPATLPTFEKLALQRCLAGLTNTTVDLATLASPLTDPEELNDPHVVKAIAPLSTEREVAYARDFVRKLDDGFEAPFWRHIPLYAYRRETLDRLASLAPSTRELLRQLEPMRALDHDMKIAVVKVDTSPLSVDTPADLELARRTMKA
ncbi:MAG: NTP transferase domain-containing protein [Alphaproteobacteria bacterium]|nr:NTP transferase domain-containing protein [Alphaproteobacteria bacterium]